MNIFIVDDNDNDIDVIKHHLLTMSIKHDQDFTTETFVSGESLIEYYKSVDVSPTIIFLDIEMDGMNGIETAKALRDNFSYNGLLVFETNHAEFVFDSFSVGTNQYLVKPVTYEKFEKKVLSLINEFKSKDEESGFIVVNAMEGGTQVIPLKEIYAISTGTKQRNVLILFLRDTTMEIYGAMTQFTEKLNDKGFHLSHRTNLINLKYIKKIIGTTIHMSNQTKFKLSRYQKKELEDRLMELTAM